MYIVRGWSVGNITVACDAPALPDAQRWARAHKNAATTPARVAAGAVRLRRSCSAEFSLVSPRQRLSSPPAQEQPLQFSVPARVDVERGAPAAGGGAGRGERVGWGDADVGQGGGGREKGKGSKSGSIVGAFAKIRQRSGEVARLAGRAGADGEREAEGAGGDEGGAGGGAEGGAGAGACAGDEGEGGGGGRGSAGRRPGARRAAAPPGGARGWSFTPGPRGVCRSKWLQGAKRARPASGRRARGPEGMGIGGGGGAARGSLRVGGMPAAHGRAPAHRAGAGGRRRQ